MKVDFNDMRVGGFTYGVYRGLSTQYAEAAELGECLDTMTRVKDGDFESWVREWAATADRVSAFAERELQKGDKISARKAFLRASNYYRMAVFYAAHTDPRHTLLLWRSKACFQSMSELMHRPIERIDIDFEGARLPAYFASAGEGKRPTLIVVGGFDSTMEEAYGWIGPVAAEYGWHCLIFEGPGQWSALKNNPGLVLRPDYEKPVTAVIDALLARSDVDESRLALIGYSLGGHLAMRGALDPRIKACIANSLIVDLGAAYRIGPSFLQRPQVFDALIGLVMKQNVAARWGFQHSQWTLGVHRPHDWLKAFAPFTLQGLEPRFRNPFFFLFGEDDIHTSFIHSPALVVGLLDYMLALDCDRYIHLFTRRVGASSHCQMGGLTYAQGQIFQWLDHVLGDKPLVTETNPAAAEKIVDVFGRYGGKEGAAKASRLLSVAHLV